MGGGRIRQWWITTADHTIRSYLFGWGFNPGDIRFIFYGARLVFLSFLWKPQYIYMLSFREWKIYLFGLNSAMMEVKPHHTYDTRLFFWLSLSDLTTFFTPGLLMRPIGTHTPRWLAKWLEIDQVMSILVVEWGFDVIYNVYRSNCHRLMIVYGVRLNRR